MEEKLPFNPKFENLEQEENAEIKFFCESFSLIDAVNNSNLLLHFATQVQESSDGQIDWTKIPDFFPKNNQSQSYRKALERIGKLLESTIRGSKGWVTPMRTRSLSQFALEAYQYRRNNAKQLLENEKSSFDPALSKAWMDMSTKLREIAKFQIAHMSYHADFQKENYMPHPDSWKLYAGTFLILFSSLVYSVIT